MPTKQENGPLADKGLVERREIARLIANYRKGFVSGSIEHTALLRAEQIALCPCDHN